MLVNDITLAKIAAQMGYKPFVAEDQEMGLTKCNRIIDNTVINDFIADYKAAIPAEDSTGYLISKDFSQNNKIIINRAIKKETSIIISENSSLGRDFLNQEIIKRIDILEFLISSNELIDFKAHILNKSDRYNPTFERAKALIIEWFTEKPIDYIGLLEGRLITKDYEQYFHCCIAGDTFIKDAFINEKQIYILYDTSQNFSGTAIRIAEKAPRDLDVTFTLKLSENCLNQQIAAWQLRLAGYIEKDQNVFEFNATKKDKKLVKIECS